MRIPPGYKLTSSIIKHLHTIEACKAVVETYPVRAEIITNIRRGSLLKSSLFSARIEGNRLDRESIKRAGHKSIEKIEIENIVHVLEKLGEYASRDLTLEDVLNWHTMAMRGLPVDFTPGMLRMQVSAIFNISGVAVYMPPPPGQIRAFMDKLIEYVNESSEDKIPLRAVLSHFIFEKIHPFIDGNGRTGRILMQYVLKRYGYDMKGLLSPEEYLDNERELYYSCLENKTNDVTEYVEFMLGILAKSSSEAKDKVMNSESIRDEDLLLPRRGEILSIIRDHRMASFDMIRRRFPGINPRTLRYDLKKLQDDGWIVKMGTTKGVCYRSVKS